MSAYPVDPLATVDFLSAHLQHEDIPSELRPFQRRTSWLESPRAGAAASPGRSLTGVEREPSPFRLPPISPTATTTIEPPQPKLSISEMRLSELKDGRRFRRKRHTELAAGRELSPEKLQMEKRGSPGRYREADGKKKRYSAIDDIGCIGGAEPSLRNSQSIKSVQLRLPGM